VLELGADETVLDVSGDGRGEESRFLGCERRQRGSERVGARTADLRDETDLSAKPFDVEVLEFHAVELDTSADRVAEESDGPGLALRKNRARGFSKSRTRTRTAQ
jgi:hypothetical protein